MGGDGFSLKIGIIDQQGHLQSFHPSSHSPANPAKADQARINSAYETVPDGQTSRWVNPNNGDRFSVTPEATYKNQYGQDCREAEILATVDGRPEKIIQKACRDQYGNWVAQ